MSDAQRRMVEDVLRSMGAPEAQAPAAAADAGALLCCWELC